MYSLQFQGCAGRRIRNMLPVAFTFKQAVHRLHNILLLLNCSPGSLDILRDAATTPFQAASIKVPLAAAEQRPHGSSGPVQQVKVHKPFPGYHSRATSSDGDKRSGDADDKTCDRRAKRYYSTRLPKNMEVFSKAALAFSASPHFGFRRPIRQLVRGCITFY